MTPYVPTDIQTETTEARPWADSNLTVDSAAGMLHNRNGADDSHSGRAIPLETVVSMRFWDRPALSTMGPPSGEMLQVERTHGSVLEFFVAPGQAIEIVNAWGAWREARMLATIDANAGRDPEAAVSGVLIDWAIKASLLWAFLVLALHTARA